MKKGHAWPEGHWNWPIDVTHKHGVRCGEMVWVGGQVDLTPTGVVCNPGGLAAQTGNAMANFARVLDELDCDLEDLVTLLCFYVNDGGVDETEFLASVGECLPPGAHPAVTAVPVPYLAYEGLQVEIEGYAATGIPLPRHAVDDVKIRIAVVALHANLPIRSSYFADPGPATTGVPLPVLAYDAMMVEIDAFAMKRRSERQVEAPTTNVK